MDCLSAPATCPGSGIAASGSGLASWHAQARTASSMPGTMTCLSDDAAVPVSCPRGPHRYCRRSRWQPPAAARRENSGRRRPCAGAPAPGSAPCGATSAGAASTGGSWQGSPASTANLGGNSALTHTSSTCVCVPRHGLSASGAAPACAEQATPLAHHAAGTPTRARQHRHAQPDQCRVQQQCKSVMVSPAPVQL